MTISVCLGKSKKFLGITVKDNANAAKRFDYFVNNYFINVITKGYEDVNYLNILEIGNKYKKDFLIHDS
jgi:hypothetical protein